MPSPNTQLRVLVDKAAEHHIIQLARQEGRSISNMSARLLNEALHARLHAQSRSPERTNANLVAAIRGQPT
jgi:hypothetical protein